MDTAIAVLELDPRNADIARLTVPIGDSHHTTDWMNRFDATVLSGLVDQLARDKLKYRETLAGLEWLLAKADELFKKAR